jgi:prevent-host-death family protein
MMRIGVRELRQHASRYLARVKAGETIEVTSRGELVALLVAPRPSDATRDLLIRSGGLTPAEGPFELPIRVKSSVITESTTDALSELREERLP